MGALVADADVLLLLAVLVCSLGIMGSFLIDITGVLVSRIDVYSMVILK